MPQLGEKKNKNPSENRKKMTARLMAVQAIYESGHNGEPLEQVLRDYLDNRSGMETDDGTLETPDRELFLQIARGVKARREEIEAILAGHLPQREETQPRKDVEPLLKAVLLCGLGEILMHPEIDAPLMINDYLEVTRAFYDKGEVSLVNGVLDAAAGRLRS